MPSNETDRRAARHDVESFFLEQGFGNVELLEGWDGEDLEDLRDLLSEEEYERLLDRFGDEDAWR